METPPQRDWTTQAQKHTTRAVCEESKAVEEHGRKGVDDSSHSRPFNTPPSTYKPRDMRPTLCFIAVGLKCQMGKTM